MQLSQNTSLTATNWLMSSDLSKQKAQQAHHCREEKVSGNGTHQLGLTKTKRGRRSTELRMSLQFHRSKAVASRTTVCSEISPKSNILRKNSASQRSELISAKSLPFQLDRGLQVSSLDTESASRNFSRLSLKQ